MATYQSCIMLVEASLNNPYRCSLSFTILTSNDTMAAQRLFGHEFPHLFEWVLGQAGDLPMPRKSNKAQSPKPLYAAFFSA